VEIGRVAHWVFLGVRWIVPVLLIGGFEGLYTTWRRTRSTSRALRLLDGKPVPAADVRDA
jgi:hypothetical protein